MPGTYNLAATDLITLLNSTVTNQTGAAILDSISSAFKGDAFPFGKTSVQTSNGPVDTPPPYPAGYKFDQSTVVAAGTQLELIVLPGSTSVTGSAYSTISGAGMEATRTDFTFLTSGDVVIGAGDQNVAVTDYNSGTAPDTLIGGVGTEKLISGAGSNVLVAGSGANTLKGGQYADTLLGGGDSRLVAGSGNNVLKSSTLSTGSDTLVGGSGRSLLVAQAGNNRLVGSTVFGSANTLEGGTGRDTLVSGGGRTTFDIGSGATRVVESVAGARDTIFAGSGADTVALTYGTSNEAASIVGSSAALRIIDLSGSNTIVGGAGATTVVLTSTAYSGNGSTQTNTSDQTITAGAGGTIRVVTNEAYSNYSDQTAAGGVNTITFKDTGQTLTVNDTTGNSVTIVFGDGHPGVKV